MRKLVGYLLPVLITVLFLYLAFRGIDLNRSFGLIVHASLIWLAVYLVVFFLSHFARALRWKIMVMAFKPDASVFNLFGATMIGYGVNCVVPRLGELYRGLFLGKWEGLSRSTMLGTIVVERVIDIASFTLAALISVFIYSGNLFQDVPWLEVSLKIGAVSILVMIIALVLLVKYEEKFTKFIIKLIGKVNRKFSEKLSRLLSTLIEGLFGIQGFSNILLFVILTLLIFVFYALNSYVGFYMIGMDKLNAVNFSMAWVFMAITAFSVLIPTPGGTGSYHIISIFVLSKLYNFSYEVSAAYAILSHFIQYVVFIGSTVFLIYIINKRRERKGASKENFLSVFNIKLDEK